MIGLDFDLTQIESLEFGVGLTLPSSIDFISIPIKAEVRPILLEMLSETAAALEKHKSSEEVEEYSPSERYPAVTCLKRDTSEMQDCELLDLVTVPNFQLAAGLPDLDACVLYFCRFTDINGNHLVGIRRSQQLKALLNRRNRLVSWFDDALRPVSEQLLKLDRDFDLLLDNKQFVILRAASFEYLAVDDADILSAVHSNVGLIEPDVAFVDFENVKEYASSHIRAARTVASIRSFKPEGTVDQNKLKTACSNCGFKLEKSGEKLLVPDGNVMDFLEILDRRRYQVYLVIGKTENYRARSRQKVRVDNPS